MIAPAPDLSTAELHLLIALGALEMQGNRLEPVKHLLKVTIAELRHRELTPR